MGRATLRMGQLIDDLLKLSRVTRAEMSREPVDLSALVSAIAKELSEAEPERRVELLIAQRLICHGDARLLRIALNNLLGNAWKFTSRQPHAAIEFGVDVQDGEKVYFVRDNGAGFDQSYSAKLFRPFQRLHSQAEFAGNGVGLATVERIVRRHGGRIWAAGVPGHGATFSFTLKAQPE